MHSNFFSDYFSDLQSRDFFYKIYEFFQSFQLLYTFKVKELWIKNQSVFESEVLFRELELFKIIEFITNFKLLSELKIRHNKDPLTFKNCLQNLMHFHIN